MNAQLDFLGRLPAGSQPITTSEQAADRLTPDRLHAMRLNVLRYIVSRGEHGATADEVVAAFERIHNSVAPRVTDLFNQRLVEKLDGEDGRPLVKRRTRQGGSALVHVASELGRRVVGRAA